MIPAKSTTVSCATTAMRPKVTPAPPHSAAGARSKLRIAVLRGLLGAQWLRLLRAPGLGRGLRSQGGRQCAPHPSGLREANPVFSSRWTRRLRELKWPSGTRLFGVGLRIGKNDPPKADDPSPQDVCRGLEGREEGRGPEGPWVLPSLSEMMMSLSGCREGMVSFPAGSSLRPGYLLRQSKPQKALCKRASPSLLESALARNEKVAGETVFQRRANESDTWGKQCDQWGL